jgi:hypothetical protein
MAKEKETLSAEQLAQMTAACFDISVTQPETRKQFPIPSLADQKKGWRDVWLKHMAPLVEAIRSAKDARSQIIALRPQMLKESLIAVVTK